jgi:hypothetical protein
LGARFLAMAFSLRGSVSAHSPRHRGSLTWGFTIARIIWQGWQHHRHADGQLIEARERNY